MATTILLTYPDVTANMFAFVLATPLVHSSTPTVADTSSSGQQPIGPEKSTVAGKMFSQAMVDSGKRNSPFK